MRSLPLYVAASLLLACFAAGAETTANECSLAVLDLKAQGLADDEAHVTQILTDSIATELSGATRCRVVTQADIASMLDFEAQKMACASESASCLAEIGSALGVGRVVTGSVGKLGSSFTVQLKLIDIDKAIVLERVELTVLGGGEELRVAAKNGARQLYGLPPLEGESGSVSADDDGAQSAFSSPFLWTGVGLIAAGLVTATAGGAVGVWADGQLGVPDVTGKSDLVTLGLVGVGIGVVGGAASLVGLGLVPVAFLE